MKEINTPFGVIKSKVILFPIYYLIFVFGFIYILPFGIYRKLFISEDSLIEWLQFICYFASSIISFLIISFDKNKNKFKLNNIFWLILAIFCFCVICTIRMYWNPLTRFKTYEIGIKRNSKRFRAN